MKTGDVQQFTIHSLSAYICHLFTLGLDVTNLDTLGTCKQVFLWGKFDESAKLCQVAPWVSDYHSSSRSLRLVGSQCDVPDKETLGIQTPDTHI